MTKKPTYEEMKARVSVKRGEVIITEKEYHAGLQYSSLLDKRPIIQK
jgi:hypothetical protein